MSANYLALADALESKLAHLEPGAKLPSEHDLRARHGVSRVTARGALRELEQRHLVRRARGSGTYVSLRLPYPLRPGTSPSWSQVIGDAGHVATYRVDDIVREDATPPIARSLCVPIGSPIIRISRVGFVDGDPATHQTMRFPAAAFGPSPDIVAELGVALADQPSTTTLLAERYGIDLTRSATRAELCPIDAPRAKMLDLNGRPMTWRTETLNRCRITQQPIERTTAWLRADTFAVFMEVGSQDGLDPLADREPPQTLELDQERP